MPTDKHQSILEFIYKFAPSWMQRIGGKVHSSSVRIQIAEDKYRTPDVLLVLNAAIRVAKIASGGGLI